MKFPSGRTGYAISISIFVSLYFHYYIDEIRHPYIIGALMLNFIAFFLLTQYVFSFILLIKKIVVGSSKLIKKVRIFS